ncbi:MAG TPA: HAD-IIB family hydrolase [Candidatus Paceibacterota bacterium]
MKTKLSQKSLIVFDLDGTLAESKAPLKPDMARALKALLTEKKAAVIGGGSYEVFKDQLVKHLPLPPQLLEKLFLFPTTSTAFYRYRNGAWRNVYRKTLSASDKKRIVRAFHDAFKQTGYVRPKKLWGTEIEDRGSQVTFSALGQDVVTKLGRKGITMKEQWFKDNQPLRLKMVKIMNRELKKFEVRSGGLTSIDVTQKGIDKAYGVRQIEKMLRVKIKDMVFIGDALYPGGNDAAAKKTGVQTISTTGPKATIRIIKKILGV